MRCKDCPCNVKGFFQCKPDSYVCIGVKEPFAIENTDVECTEYPEMRDETCKTFIEGGVIDVPDPVEAYVGDDGIYIPYELNPIYHRMLISKDLFVEAYNKWIKPSTHETFIGQDDADDWSED